RRSVTREIRFQQIQISIEIVVSSRNAHARLRLAVGAQRTTGFQRDVYKFSVLLVLIKSACSGIVGDVNIRPAIIVEIGCQHSQSESSVCLENPRALGNIRESSITIVVIEDVLSTL